jgi:glyoxylase-like metal-dependent hydrolase (beta-lactamase superfamily II)
MTDADPIVDGFHDPRTGSVQYVVGDPATGRCAIIDPVLDYDEKSAATATHSADALLAHVARRGWTLDWVLDTHPHADHLSAAGYLRRRSGARTGIGARITAVQALWKRLYHLPEDFAIDGSQWDHLFENGEGFTIGSLAAQAMLSPGHTLASVTYCIGNAAFIHDTLFMPDSGTARADFPGGDAQALWHSIQRILALPARTRLFTGHDYRPRDRPAAWESTVAAQRAENIHLTQAPDEAVFVALRQARDRTLPVPKLMLHALQVNIAGGVLPAPEANGRRYLKIPLNALGDHVWE